MLNDSSSCDPELHSQKSVIAPLKSPLPNVSPTVSRTAPRALDGVVGRFTGAFFCIALLASGLKGEELASTESDPSGVIVQETFQKTIRSLLQTYCMR